jgi:hypothetical protein
MHLTRIVIIVAVALLLHGCGSAIARAAPQALAPEPEWVSVSCFADPPETAVTEIRIRREGGCLGYMTTATAPPGPIFHTGRCAGYRMTLRSDGSAEYEGVDNVPMIGKRTGRLDHDIFRRLGRLAEEIGFASWEEYYPPQQKSANWVCMSMDGEGPLSITVVTRSGSKTIRHEQNVEVGPAWLAVFEAEVERAAESISWR